MSDTSDVSRRILVLHALLLVTFLLTALSAQAQGQYDQERSRLLTTFSQLEKDLPTSKAAFERSAISRVTEWDDYSRMVKYIHYIAGELRDPEALG